MVKFNWREVFNSNDAGCKLQLHKWKEFIAPVPPSGGFSMLPA